MASESSKSGFLIAGIGAAAGGVEACQKLLATLSKPAPVALILVLNPEPDSDPVEALSVPGGMPVCLAEDGVSVTKGTFYIIPAECMAVLQQGRIRLSPASAAGQRPIDHFLESMATDQGVQAIGILLSGAASEGTHGLAAIKAEGGITLVQDPNTALHSGLPQGAIEEGLADMVLPPERLAQEIESYAARFPTELLDEGRETESVFARNEDFVQVLSLLEVITTVDFTHYRDSTLRRRIFRRMALTKQETMGEYIRYLRENRAEVEALFRDILINVTRFFRDSEVFESLKTLVFPILLKERSVREPLRFWVTGCSTGQEAYSLAIVLLEFLADVPNPPQYQIFASDIIESGSLDRARAGLYPETIEADVSTERLRRFFTKEERGYRISKDIRSRCIFAKHDLTNDPPFSKLDLVTCRNVLIYMAAPLQRKILPIFHYSLKPERFLLLGPSETIGRDSDLFHIVDREKKLYLRKSTVARLPTFTVRNHASSSHLTATRAVIPVATNADFQREADRILLNRFAPAGVLVNSNLDILQFRGRTRPYLEPPQGEASFSLLKMANEGMFAEIHLAVQDSLQQNAAVRRESIRVWEEGRIRNIHLEIIPVSLPTSSEMCFLVLFEEANRADAGKGPGLPRQEASPIHEDLAQLRKENGSLREYLQLVREQHEASTEELKSSNEELLSSNEELQSTNEELETAKEEYQSANEELTTLNEEMATRNQEMVQLNNDLTNLLNTLIVPIVIVGSGMRIRRFTPAAEKPMRLVPTDVGRKLEDIKLGLEGPNLEEAVQDVISKMMPVSQEMRDREGRWYSVQVHPYRTADNHIEGAVIILIDIHGLKTAHERLRDSEEYARAIVDTIREPMVILREDLRVNTANASFYDTFRLTPEETQGLPIYKLGGGRWNIAEVRSLIEDTLAKDARSGEFEMEHDFPGLGNRVLRLNARKLLWKRDASPMVLLAIEDITVHRRAEAALRDQSRKLEQAVQERTSELLTSSSQMESFSYSVSHDLRAPLRAMQGYAEALLEDWGGSINPAAREYVEKIVQAGSRMDRLILDVLTYSRAAMGEIRIREIDTEALAREVIAHHPELTEKGAQIDIVSPLARVMGHEPTLAQCLSNLLVNAVKFVAAGTAPRITIRTENIHSLVRIWVEDNGIGVEPEDQQKIFGMFEKLHAQDVYPGTGIGLAIVKKAAERMGGMVGMESSPGTGSGSRFWIQLTGSVPA